MRKRVILAVFAVLFIGVAALVFYGQHQVRTAEIYYSGTIEATEANLAFQVSGRVRQVEFDEGQAVAAGRILASLDQAEFLAQERRVQADLQRAEEAFKQSETALALLRQALPSDVARAQAAVAASAAQLQELEAGSRIQDIERARLAAEAARAALENARKDKQRLAELFAQKIVPEKDKESADLKFETALADYERAQKAYDLAKEGSRKETIAVARARLAEAQAVQRQAEINLGKIDVSAQEVATARAQVAAAAANLELARIQLAHTHIQAPFDGILVSRNVEPGEVVTPGREVLTVADLSQVDLKIFVDETQIGKVKPQQPMEIKTDTFPDKVYHGTVTYISPEAEFTPKIIQTRKERVKLVYLVKVSIPNPDLELKPGMPADAWFR